MDWDILVLSTETEHRFSSRNVVIVNQVDQGTKNATWISTGAISLDPNHSSIFCRHHSRSMATKNPREKQETITNFKVLGKAISFLVLLPAVQRTAPWTWCEVFVLVLSRRRWHCPVPTVPLWTPLGKKLPHVPTISTSSGKRAQPLPSCPSRAPGSQGCPVPSSSRLRAAHRHQETHLSITRQSLSSPAAERGHHQSLCAF